MFTGLVEKNVPIARSERRGPGVRLELADAELAGEAQLGESIALAGCCLTVVDIAADRLAFDVGPETLSRTTLGSRVVGDLLNVERSLRLGDRLGGHLVTGHIDGLAVLRRRVDEQDWSTFEFRLPRELAPQLASKGSITLDGVSLTLVDVGDDRFSVALIPHTLSVTTLGNLRPGDEVNVETDLLAKYVGRQLGFAAAVRS